MRYSVVIPIYNAEKTIRRCLDSLASQVRDDIEILMIDDGSKDDSGQICLSYSTKYTQFHYFHQENSGVSAARNRGLELARGEYILFVDSDDYVDEKYFSILDELTADPSVDLAMFATRFFGGRNFDSKFSAGVWEGRMVSPQISCWMKDQLLNSLWSKVFKRVIIEKEQLHFDQSLSISEDLDFVFSYSIHAGKISADDRILYYVSEENQGSLSRKIRDNLSDQMILAHQRMTEALAAFEGSASDYHIYSLALSRNFYRSAYSAAKELIKEEPVFKNRCVRIRKICDQFNRNHVAFGNLENSIIALPVRFRMSHLIDRMVTRRAK